MHRFDLPPEIQVTENTAGIHFQLPWRKMSSLKKAIFWLTLLLVPGPFLGAGLGLIIFAAVQPWNLDMWMSIGMFVGILWLFGGVALFVTLLCFLQRETITLNASYLEMKRFGGTVPLWFVRPRYCLQRLVLAPLVSKSADEQLAAEDRRGVLEVECYAVPTMVIGRGYPFALLQPLGHALGQVCDIPFHEEPNGQNKKRQQKRWELLDGRAPGVKPPKPEKWRLTVETTSEGVLLRDPPCGMGLFIPLYVYGPLFLLLCLVICAWVLLPQFNIVAVLVVVGLLFLQNTALILRMYHLCNKEAAWLVTKDALIFTTKGPCWPGSTTEWSYRAIEKIGAQAAENSRRSEQSFHLLVGLESGAEHRLCSDMKINALFWLLFALKNELERPAARDAASKEKQ
jgi:hypothetical protein